MREAPAPVFGIDANVIAGMQALGAPPDAIEAAQDRLQTAANHAETETFGLYPENAKPFFLFTGLATQWRHAGMDGQRTGLDYAAAKAVLSARHWRYFFTDLQLMERAVLQADRELHQQKA